ncbi:Tex family protein [Dethiobacter alkaliphilus]|uniref:Tex family protein n=1 Tax=Dethiobacter alkaliphilus TaxID=427926 RepID=UPI002227CA12|nr:Tex family protein [Dethiobacter alkaliphilus]MCW3490990.1 RNA-binding transcriptional accessory protein [Dethiobacter alkaliphilus]
MNTNERINQRIAADLGLSANRVAKAVALLDEGNTVPFIARYRKEVTEGLDDEQLRLLSEKLNLYRNLEKTREDILRLLDEQGVLTPELEAAVTKAATATELEDLYRPYRPKKRTRATIAKEKGLEPLAYKLLEGIADPFAEAENYLNEEHQISTAEDALSGARDIIAEIASDEPRPRKEIRSLIFNRGLIVSRGSKEEESPYEMYYEFSEPLKKVQPHRVLAMNRGEKEDFLSIKLEFDEDQALAVLEKHYVPRQMPEETKNQVASALKDGWKRLLFPSLEREVRNEITVGAEEQALKIFKANLRGLLLTPPVPGKRILGLDPGYRTGCKLACVDQTGKLLETAVIYPTPPLNKKEASAAVVKKLIEKHDLNTVAIGNGTAGRESEEFIAEVISEMNREIEYTVVNEAGASVYSASKLGKAEFPDLDVAERSAISIARRVQDPLAELVKIDPRSIGVGQYQHDVNQKRLEEVLGGVVEDTVNQVGVDLTTASAPLLGRVAGINKTIAANIVAYREEHGTFKTKKELLKVAKLGPAAFKQSAGFLRIPDADNYLDRSAVHPESYQVAQKLIDIMEIDHSDLGKPQAIPQINIKETAAALEVGEPTLQDIVEEFKKPGRDPREDVPKPVFKKGVLHLEDLQEGMELTGVVRNVVDFGAFVDIGVHQDGLIHISQLSNKFVKHPLEVVQVGDVVEVKVISLDVKKKRIGLTRLHLQ